MLAVLLNISRTCPLRTTMGIRFQSSMILSAQITTVPSRRPAAAAAVVDVSLRRFGTTKTSANPRDQKERKRLDVAIVGAPNAGKSQLLNVLTQSNVAAVSRKRHTTRDGILGARTVGNTQLVFIDTPGFLRLTTAKKEGLLKDMIEAATDEMKHADYTLVVIDAARKLTDDQKEALVTLMLQAKFSEGRVEAVFDENEEEEKEQDVPLEKFAIVLNKVDLVNPKRQLLDVATAIGTIADECILYRGDTEAELEGPHEMSEDDLKLLVEASPPIFYISALKDDGVDDILKHLLNRATPCRAWAVAPGAVTEMSPVERAEEVIREKIYRCLHREVPHQVKQVNRIFQTLRHKETGEKAVRIDQDLVVRTKSHHRLVKGKGGMNLNRIKETAKNDLEKIFECPVMLNLHVKLNKSKHDRQLEAEEYGMQSEIKLNK